MKPWIFKKMEKKVIIKQPEISKKKIFKKKYKCLSSKLELNKKKSKKLSQVWVQKEMKKKKFEFKNKKKPLKFRK